MYVSRIRLSRAASETSEYWDTAGDVYGVHQLIWRFFDDHADRRRDFIFRFEHGASGPTFHVVSGRKPSPAANLPFDVETKDYDPQLNAGDTLAFILRANPTKRDNGGKGDERARHDVVMVEKRRLAATGEAYDLRDIVQETGNAWLARQAAQHGFEVAAGGAAVTGHRPHRFRKTGGGSTISVSGMDFEGLLEVTDPVRFREALVGGVGPAKGFGFGLMMVRRA